MKKMRFILPLMVVATFAAVMVLSPSKAVCLQKSTQPVSAIPDDVAQILSNSCGSCHNTGGSRMAMSMWNLADWGTYPAEKQVKKANAICSAVTKGSMPPGSFKRSNPDKIPAAAHTETVCKWANSLNGK